MTPGEKRTSAAEWTVRLQDHKELSHAEKLALADFVRESSTHVRELIEHTFINEDLKALRIPQSDLDTWIAEARSAVSVTIPFPETHTPASSRMRADGSGVFHREVRRLWLPRTRLLVAASLAAILTIGGVFLHSRIGLYTTGFGEQRTLTLADGSVVTLNTESQIKVEFSHAKRSISLKKGEALFRVAHDPGRPFFVDTKDTIVSAVGTEFNVKIGLEDTVVSVLDGVVNVSLTKDSSSGGTGSEKPRATLSAPRTIYSDSGTKGEGPRLPREDSRITLTKGEQARIEGHEFSGGSAVPPISKAETPAALHAAAWAQGQIQFDGTPLAEVLSEFQRYRQFDVEFEDDAMRQLKLTGSFDSHDSESALAYIATIPGIAVEKRGPRLYFIHRR